MFVLDLFVCVCRTVWAYRLLRTHTERHSTQTLTKSSRSRPACVHPLGTRSELARLDSSLSMHRPLYITYKSPFFISTIPLPHSSWVDSTLIISNSAQSQPNFYIPTILCAFLLPMQSRNFRIFNTHTHTHTHWETNKISLAELALPLPLPSLYGRTACCVSQHSEATASSNLYLCVN